MRMRTTRRMENKKDEDKDKEEDDDELEDEEDGEEDEDEEEGHSPGCRSVMPHPCRGRPRRAPAWECTGNREQA